MFFKFSIFQHQGCFTYTRNWHHSFDEYIDQDFMIKYDTNKLVSPFRLRSAVRPKRQGKPGSGSLDFRSWSSGHLVDLLPS